MKTTLSIILTVFSFTVFAQTNPAEVKVSDKLLITNEGDTSQLVIKSATQSSVLDLQGANTSTIRFLQNNVSKAEVRLSGNNFDLYSTPPVTFPLLRTPTIRMTPERFVGISKGLLSPTETLDISGRLKIGYKEGSASPGVLRYNPDEKKFESYNGAGWKSFGSLSLDDDGDSGISLVEGGVDSIVFKVNGNDEMRFGGHSLEFGKDGNTYVGKGVTPSDVPQNIANTVTGWLSARMMSSGVSNTINGFRSSEELTSGDFNTIVGSQTANKLGTGSRNTYLGYRAGWNAAAGNSGNVYLGYRAGEGFIGDDRLVISNSQTTTPLIEGNFATQDLIINGDTRVEGTSILNGAASVFGNLSSTGQVTGTSYTVNATSPFIDFKTGATSKFYIQYRPAGDELIIHRTGQGDVLRLSSNGDIYFPQLGGGDAAALQISSTGKVFKSEFPTSHEYYFIEELNTPEESNSNLIVVKDLREGEILTELVIRAIWPGFLSNPTEVRFYKMNKVTRVKQLLASITNLPTANYNQEFSASFNHIVDTDSNFYYLLLHEDSYYSYIQLNQ